VRITCPRRSKVRLRRHSVDFGGLIRRPVDAVRIWHTPVAISGRLQPPVARWLVLVDFWRCHLELCNDIKLRLSAASEKDLQSIRGGKWSSMDFYIGATKGILL